MIIEKIVSQLNAKSYALQPESALLTDEEKAFLDVYAPDKTLIVYGTLAPGRPNHSVVADIAGMWHKVVIKGTLIEEGWGAAQGYPVFTPDAQGWPIEAYVLRSVDLAAHWLRLDDFEGDGYRRILAVYELKDVGHIYALDKP